MYLSSNLMHPNKIKANYHLNFHKVMLMGN